MSRILYIDPWAGAAGDMLLSALLDLESSSAKDITEPRPLEELLLETVERLGVGDVELVIERVTSKGIGALRLDVVDPCDGVVRGPAEAEAVVLAAELPEEVTRRSVDALRRLARVEATIHGIPVERVHFHELGAVDTLVDVVGGFALWHALGAPQVVCGPLPLGAGSVRIAHGLVGIPAPATLELCRGIPVRAGEERGEITTPTGALMVTELASAWGVLPSMVLEAVGYGAGHMELEHGPNVMRVMLGAESGEVTESSSREGRVEGVWLLETQLDDCAGERLAYVQSSLLEAGALDAWLRPVVMKKGRPGMEIAVLGTAQNQDELEGILIRESGTLGVRRRWVERRRVDRSWVEVDVEGMAVRVKVGWWHGEPVTVAAEYEDAAAAARRLGCSLESVMSAAAAGARALV